MEIKIKIFEAFSSILLAFIGLQRFSFSVSDKKSESKSAGLMHHDKLGGGSEAALAAPGAPDPRSHSGGNTGASQASVKKEPGEAQHRDRGSGRYSPPDFGYHHHSRVSPVSHHSPAYHGYHVDKSLLPPTLSGPHSTDLHSQKFDFFRPNAGVDTGEHARGLQTNGLC